jgi:hypothetical protein
MIDLPPRILISSLMSVVRLGRNACPHAFRDMQFLGYLSPTKKTIRLKAYAVLNRR